MNLRPTLNSAKDALWWVSLGFVLGGIWTVESLYVGITLFVVYLFSK